MKQQQQKTPSTIVGQEDGNTLSSSSICKETEKGHGMAFAQQNNRIVKISPRKGATHHHYYQHKAAKGKRRY